MDIKSKVSLSSPISDDDGLRSFVAFDLDSLKIWKDHVQVSVHPAEVPVVRIYPVGALDVAGNPLVTSKGRVVLNASQTPKLTNFIQAIQDAVKTNFEFPWPT